MTNQETNSQNYFQTALTGTVSASALTFPVASLGLLTTPCWMVIDPDSVTNREVILFDGVFGASSFVTSGLGQRDQAGTAPGGAKEHAIGVKVESRPLKQHIEDLNDRVDYFSDHDNLSGLADDDHTQYLNTARHDVTTRHPVSVLGSDGLGLGLRQVVKFTTSGTFDKADYPWLRHVSIRDQAGGGGGGGSGTPGDAGGGGGGGGGYAEKFVAVASLAASETVTVGAAGVAGAATGNGGTGGTSSFGSHASANGGAGGLATDGGGGEGGVGTAGDILVGGSGGGTGTASSTVAISGAGGGSRLGGGGASRYGQIGVTGRLYGGGGAGGARVAAGGTTGGAGAAGIVIVELYA
jgi:hypothetical protein